MDVEHMRENVRWWRRWISTTLLEFERPWDLSVRVDTRLIDMLCQIRAAGHGDYLRAQSELRKTFDACATPELRRIDREAKTLTAREKNLSSEIEIINAEIGSLLQASQLFAKTADREDRRSRLFAMIEALRAEITSYESDRRSCDMAALRLRVTGSAEAREAFATLKTRLAEQHVWWKSAAPQLSTIELELASLPPQTDVPEFDSWQKSTLQDRLNVAELALRTARVEHAKLDRLRDDITSIGKELSSINPSVERLLGLLEEVKAANTKLSLEAKDALLTRGVTRLLHFTRAGNLLSIMRDGLKSRSRLEQDGATFLPSDTMRLDGLPNTVSLSIQFPNYQMLHKKRLQHDEYVIIEVSPDFLSAVDAIFVPCNAAKSGALSNAVPARNNFGLAGVSEVFGDNDATRLPLRLERQLPTNYPFSPQAEVLVCGTIEPKYITRILVPSLRSHGLVAKALAESGLRCDLEFDWAAFDRRCDWRYW